MESQMMSMYIAQFGRIKVYKVHMHCANHKIAFDCSKRVSFFIRFNCTAEEREREKKRNQFRQTHMKKARGFSPINVLNELYYCLLQ